MNHTIESSKLFPYIAWTTVILFALFTYSVAQNVRTQLNEIAQQTDQLEAQASAETP